MDAVAINLLTQILSTPGFRNWLQTDPVAALASVSISLAPNTVPSPICLPSDADIQALLAADPDMPPLQSCMSVHSICGWQSH